MEKLVELVNLWAEYSRENPDLEIKDFCTNYLTDHCESVLRKEPLGEEESARPLNQESDIDGELAALVGRLTRFAYFYSKKAIEKLPVANVDDILYLHLMMVMNAPKKSELIVALLSEFASGIDIINRLLKAGLCEEFPDENDKRAKRVKITPAGVYVLHHSSPVMAQIAQIAFNELTLIEKVMITTILKRADRFHSKHYGDFKGQTFDEIYKKVMTIG
ncbi:MarR family winged helix-turn-helix transcriptional regulator [Runella slithyformis]|uniref:Regulatory protein MarR n=1 Tax=Runella slithyformis (strain ATCC 29530 / DSM 19594 / LMG 11500 / NCIMB 11436 / LSU 4) TaxID=761193 RepID=A0A7U3ZQM3_RUNSL|nr:winged helix DNA-binding protein [Runella slithyformis]AEI51577.1 regulatory protein MarR [Runella slithyformis DSM 19594]